MYYLLTDAQQIVKCFDVFNSSKVLKVLLAGNYAAIIPWEIRRVTHHHYESLFRPPRLHEQNMQSYNNDKQRFTINEGESLIVFYTILTLRTSLNEIKINSLGLIIGHSFEVTKCSLQILLQCPIQMKIFHSNKSFLPASFLPPKKEGQMGAKQVILI